MNKVKEKLKKGEYSIGSWIQLPEPAVAEIMAGAGFEWLVVDMEHGSINIETLPDLFRAMEKYGCIPFVRLPENNATIIKQVLDAGARGLVVPMINSRDDVEKLLKAAKYPPQGMRSVGFSRANLYGAEFDDYLKKINKEVVITVQIEHIEGVEQVEEIFSVPGIDAYIIGPYDLSSSMNLTGQFDHIHFKKAIRKVFNSAKHHNIAPGIHVVQSRIGELKQRVREGYSFIAYSVDSVFLNTICRQSMDEIKKIVNRCR